MSRISGSKPVRRKRPPQISANEHVEVDAAEVGAQPAGLAEPVGVGDVAVEDGPDEVDAGAEHAGPRAAVAAGARVADLVERGGGDDGAEDDQQQRRVVERGTQPAAQPVLEEHPDVQRDEPAAGRAAMTGGQNSGEKIAASAWTPRSGTTRGAEAQPEQQVGLLQLRARAVRRRRAPRAGAACARRGTRTLPALTLRPKRALTSRAIAPVVARGRRPPRRRGRGAA